MSAVVLAGPYDPPPTYYNSATGTGSTLKSQLKSIMTSGQIQRSYGDFRYSAKFTDTDPSNPNNILLVYDRASVSGVWNLNNQLPWNREHLWPQSLQPGSASNGTTGNLGDPHALRPSDTQINSDRGHKAFGFDNTSGSYGVLNNDYFYPGDADRGDVARQLFYSATRYSGLTLVEGVPGNNQMGDFSSLLTWHYSDTPDDFELRRNHAIYSPSLNPSYYTNNRNAYIDRPEYVWSVFVDQQNDSQITIAGASPDGNGGSARHLDQGRVLVGAALPIGGQEITLNKSGNDGTYYNITTTGLGVSDVTGRYNAFGTGGPDSATINVELNAGTETAGPYTGSIVIDNLDVTTSGGAGRGANDADDTITLSLDVLDHATPSFDSDTAVDELTLDFGAITQGSTMPTMEFDLFNLESTFAFTAGMDLETITPFGDATTLTTDLQPFDGEATIAAGTSETFVASFDTSSTGSFAASYVLSFVDEFLPGADFVGALTLNLTGTVEAASLASADFNEDNDIDGDDFLTWQRGLLVGSSLSEGDANDDTNVDELDLAIWRQQFGDSFSTAAGASAAVPEPASIWLCFAGLLRILWHRGFRA